MRASGDSTLPSTKNMMASHHCRQAAIFKLVAGVIFLIVCALTDQIDAKASIQTTVCRNGFATCSSNNNNNVVDEDICETAVSRDTNNCGKCGTKCPHAPHSKRRCKAGNCTFICTIREWRDCDGNNTNGCETNVNHDPNHCGRCGARCPPPPPENNAIATCSGSLGGFCGFSCNPGFKDCDGNASNGCETDVRNDVNNCGECNVKCAPPNTVGAVCVNSNCTFTGCVLDGRATDGAVIELFGDCDGNVHNGCETPFETVKNCNGCGIDCGRNFCKVQYFYGAYCSAIP